MIRKAIFFILVLFLAAGCGRKDPKIYSQDGPVADGDTLVEACTIEPKHLMPPLAADEVPWGIDGLVFNGLARFDENWDPVPCLAEKWTVSKDGKVITYYLRKGVKFHDGVEFTAEDVLFTYKVYSDPKVNTPRGSYYDEIKNVEILDPYTVRVNYKKPYPPALAQTFENILPKHLLEGKDINNCDFDRHPIGTGPYKFVEWKTGQQIVLEANPDYWEGKPHIQRFVMRIIPDPSTMFMELLKGEVDAIGPWLGVGMSAEQYARQTDTPKFKDYYNGYKTNQLAYVYTGWNPKNPLFKEKKVRQALTMAIDRNSIIQNALFGQGIICTVGFHTWANNPAIKPWPYDPAKAKEYLNEAGWKPGQDGILHKIISGKDTPFKFTLLICQGWVEAEKMGTIIQQQLKQLGIQMDVQVYEYGTWWSQFLEPHKFDAYIGEWFTDPDPADIYQILHSSQMGEHQFNFVSYSNKEADRLMEEGRETFDMKKRQKIYWKIQSILNEDQPYTFLYYPGRLIAIHKRFKGYQMNPNGVRIHPEKWYVPKDQQKYP